MKYSLVIDSIIANPSFSAMLQLKEAPVKDPERNARGSCCCSSIAFIASSIGRCVSIPDQCVSDASVKRQV